MSSSARDLYQKVGTPFILMFTFMSIQISLDLTNLDMY